MTTSLKNIRSLVDCRSEFVSTDAACYIYDALGRRISKTAGGWTNYVYDASGAVVTEYSSLPSNCAWPCWQASYIHMGDKLAAEYKDGTTYFFNQDHLGSTRFLTKPDQSLADSMDYLPYGEQIAGTSETTHKFTGKERDGETGLDYFGARYYSNGLGRFVSADWSSTPIPVPYADFSNPQTLNLYRYPSNPESYADADGHCDWCQKVKNVVSGDGWKTDAELHPQQGGDLKQQLVNAQDEARNKKEFQPGKVTHCNAATCFVAQQVGAPTTGSLTDKKGNLVNANTQAQNLAKSSDYKEVSPKEAQSLANEGKLVVVAYDNKGGGSGHLATVRPEGVPGDTPPKGGNGPLLNNVGRSVGVMNENYAFKKGTEVHYYTPK